MGLEDFERELAESKAKESRHRDSHDSEGRKRRRTHESSHRYSSHRHRSRERDRDRDHNDPRHRHKRSRKHSADNGDEQRHRRRRRKSRSRSPSNPKERPTTDTMVDDSSGESDWVEKESFAAPPGEEILDEELEGGRDKDLKRDTWMQAPSSLDVDYVQKKQKDDGKSNKTVLVGSTVKDYQLKIHEKEINMALRADAGDEDGEDADGLDAPAAHSVDYTFGDEGATWRMTKLRAVYKKAKASGRTVDEVALDQFGDLRSFDDAREEETELDRRKTYGKDYVGKIKPSGELYQERKMKAEKLQRNSRPKNTSESPSQRQNMEGTEPLARTVILDQTSLNQLKAQMMKAKLRGASNAAELESQYNEALAAASTANRQESDVVVLNAMDNRMLAGGRKGEVTAVNTTRGRERGLVEENEDMSIEDMVRQERRTKKQGNEGLLLASRIAKDSAFKNDLDYMDENASKLSKRVAQSEINLRSVAISDFSKMNKILDNCPLCHHEDTSKPPLAPVISLATRTYMALPTQPELNPDGGGAVIVPIQHRINLLECDEDEWEELRNFMKCLTRMYHDQGRAVVFYENAAHPARKQHAALQAVPLPYVLGETVSAFFRESILSSDEEWSQHRKVIDTLHGAKERGWGRAAFRRMLAKEMPYFHVWFELDGGLGHVIEDERRWPRGDLFAREVLGGMMDIGPDVIKKQGRWQKDDQRVEEFRKRWRKFDWTRVLTDT